MADGYRGRLPASPPATSAHSPLFEVVDRFGELKIVVIGEAMLDSYLVGEAKRLSREAPVPIVNVVERRDAPGACANTAANVAALGARVSLLSVVGDDAEAGLLRAALSGRGVSTEYLVSQPARRTLTKHRIVADSQILVRYDQGDTDDVAPDVEAVLIDRLGALAAGADAIVVSDYGYGVLTRNVRRVLAQCQARAPRVLVADAKDLASYRDVGVTAVKPNYAEAVRLIGLPGLSGTRARVHQVAEHGARLLDLAGAQMAAVTLDVDGALIFERNRPHYYRVFARPARRADATGAGDTFAAGLALALAAGADAAAASELAAAAAAVVVERGGTAVCGAADLRASIAGDDKQVPSVHRLAALAEVYRQTGRRTVFTNGCFDILHRGHITYLSRAKALGDVLVVGVNADDGIRRLKGPGRPINTLEDRAHVLAALSCVDHVIAFEEDTPETLIRALRPDLYVKGGDYTLDRLPEAGLVDSLGGEVRILPYVEDRSTTGIIERIRGERRREAASPDQDASQTRAY